jgi:hypothetical protein
VAFGLRGGGTAGGFPELVASSLGSSECSGNAPPCHRRYPRAPLLLPQADSAAAATRPSRSPAAT